MAQLDVREKLEILADAASTISRSIDVRPDSIAAVRAALRRAVSDETGNSHDSLAQLRVAVSAITGSGSVPGRDGDHAWCAGYVPAEEPRYAFVVVVQLLWAALLAYAALSAVMWLPL